MADNPLNPFEDEALDNPYVPQGIKRRAAALRAGPQQVVETYDPNKGNWGVETARSTALNVANDYTDGLESVARGALGDQEGAERAARRYAQRRDEARELGPRIQSFEDAEAEGGGIGDYAAALAYQGAGMIPDLVSIGSGVGIGAAVGRRAARGVVRRSIADAIENRADNVAARIADTRVAREQARQAAINAPDGARAVSNAMRVAGAQVDEVSRKAAMKEAARIAGRTPRTGTNPFQETVDRAGRWAGRAGGTLAGIPRANSGNAELIAEGDTDQGDALALLAGSAAGAATGVLPFERLVGRFGQQAARQVERDTARFLPRVAKEFGKQGLAEGSQEVVQQAIQLASHAYVKQNPELLYNDEAWNQYLASFGAGFVLGGALGGGVEAGRTGAQAARKAAGRTLRSAQDLFREGVAKYGQRARDRRPAPGEEIPAEGAPAEGVGSAFMRNLRSLGDNVGRMGRAAADRFRGTQDDVQNDEIADGMLSRFGENGQWEIPGLRRSPAQNPIELKSPMQARLMAYVADDSPVWQDKNTARRVGKALERLFGDRAKGNAVNDTDMAIYDWLVESGSVPRETMVAMKGIGHIYAGLDKEATALSEGVGAEPPDTAMAAAMREAIARNGSDQDAQLADQGVDESERAAQGDTVNAALTERTTPDAASSLRDRHATLRRAVIAANKRVQSAKTDEARQQLVAERAELDIAFKQANRALHDKILGPKGDPRGRDPLKYQYGRNVFDENKKAGNFDEKIREPGRVELVEKGKFVRRDGKTEPRRLGLSLDSLMLQEVQENSADYQNFDTESKKYKAALFRVIGDVAQAGIKIKPESFTTGEIKTRDGDFLTRVTARDVAQLRGVLAKGRPDIEIKGRERWTEQVSKPRKERALGEGGFDEGADTALGPRPVPEGRREPGTKGAIARRLQLKRPATAGADAFAKALSKRAPGAVGAGFVPTQDVVTDVVTSSPYETEVNAVRAVRRSEDSTPRAVAQAIHEAGVRIGEAELAKQDAAGVISPKRLESELARLRDPQSGAARRYFRRAAAGEFDTADVTEQRARTEAKEAIDQKELAREEKPMQRRKPETAKLAKELEAAQKADDAKRGIKSRREYDVQNDEIIAKGAESANTSSGPHDLKAEAAMLNALAEAAGARTGIVVESAGAHDPKRGGSYSRGKLRIKINDNLHGAERMEVLLHELGHHLIWNEVAKLVGWDLVQSKNMSLATAISALKAGNPKLHDALMKDFNAWRTSGKSSKPFHRAQRGNSIAFEDDAVAFHEWMADNVARALSRQKKPVGIVGKFFGKVATALRSAWRRLVASGADKNYAAAKSVDAWVRSLFDANKDAVKQVTGQSAPKATAEAAVRGAAVASAPAPATAYTAENFDDLVTLINTALKPEERQILDNVFRRGVAVKILRERFSGSAHLLDDAKASLENRIAMGYLAWQAGDFNNVGPKGTSALVDLRDNALAIMGVAGEGDLAVRVLEDIANGTVQRFHEKNKTYSVRELEARARGTRQRALNWLAKEGPVSNALARFWTSQYKRMHDSGIPAMRAIASTIQRPQGATGDEDRGLNVAMRTKTFEFQRKYASVIRDLNAGARKRVMEVLQRQAAPGTPPYDKLSPANKRAVDAMRALYAEAFAYGAEQHMFSGGEQRREFYAPVQLDMRLEGARDRLAKLYGKERYREAVFNYFGVPSTERTDEAHARLVTRLVEMAAHETADPMHVNDGMVSGVRADKKRVSQFIYDGGNTADIRELAALQTKDPDEAFARYFAPLVKAVEFRRRFGQMETTTDADGKETESFNPRGKLDAMLAEVRKQGGTDADVELAENAVKAALGTYGADGSPTLNAISPALAKKFSGPKTKATVEGLQAYQNTRLLPLALLSSLVDPMGIAVRTGGDFGTAWGGFRKGIRVLTDKKSAPELLKALEEIGSGDDFMHAIAQHPVFDGQEGGFARRVNDFVFKWNGMQALVMTTRVMAMESGHRFLLKHAAADSDLSRRYLAELSLEPGDIRPDPEKPGRVVLNDKTRAALNQFVDEAILRPNSLQVPLWHRDPYMGLLTQYKAFSYAIFDQISGRIGREMTHGNYRVMLAAMSYLPIVMAAELLRELIQYAGEGNPRRKDWGPDDYAALVVNRTGLLGPQADIIGDISGDVQRRNLPGTSQLGPTLGQAENAGDAFAGRRDLGKELEAALPGSAAWKKWNDTRVVGAEPVGA